MQKTTPTNHLSAFTLIELLVVISIVSMLIAILLPALGKAREASRAIQCASNARQVYVALKLYGQDNHNYIIQAYMGADGSGGTFNYVEYLDYKSYVKSEWNLFQCPEAQDPDFKCFILNYYICGSTWKRYDDIIRASDIVHFADRIESSVVSLTNTVTQNSQYDRISTRHEDANFAFVDGHVKRRKLGLNKSDFEP